MFIRWSGGLDGIDGKGGLYELVRSALIGGKLDAPDGKRQDERVRMARREKRLRAILDPVVYGTHRD